MELSLEMRVFKRKVKLDTYSGDTSVIDLSATALPF